VSRTCRVFFAAAAISLAAPAFAQTSSTAGGGSNAGQFDIGGDSITIGGAAAIVPDYDGSNDYRIVPAPAAIGSFHHFAFSLIGNRASIDLIPNKPGPGIDLQAGPIGVINFNRTNHKSIDDDRVAALPERDTAIELGGYVGIGKTGVITSPYDKLSVSLSYRHDVSGVHDSGIWQPSVNYLTPLSTKAAVTLFASAEHVGRGYAQTYFGISPDDTIASGLPTYSARGGWKGYTLGAAATYSLTGNLLHGLKIVAGGSYSRLLNGFSASPLVSQAGSPNQWLAAAGLAYTF
jgi:outer membrane protein